MPRLKVWIFASVLMVPKQTFQFFILFQLTLQRGWTVQQRRGPAREGNLWPGGRAVCPVPAPQWESSAWPCCVPTGVVSLSLWSDTKVHQSTAITPTVHNVFSRHLTDLSGRKAQGHRGIYYCFLRGCHTHQRLRSASRRNPLCITDTALASVPGRGLPLMGQQALLQTSSSTFLQDA